MPKQRRRAKPNSSSKNQETSNQKARNEGVTYSGDPSVEIKHRQPSKSTGRITIPTEDHRHMTKIRFGTLYPEDHFSAMAKAKIPVEDFE